MNAKAMVSHTDLSSRHTYLVAVPRDRVDREVAVDKLEAEDALPSKEVLQPLRGLRDAVRGGFGARAS